MGTTSYIMTQMIIVYLHYSAYLPLYHPVQEFEEPLPGDHFGFGRNDGIW